MGRESITIYPIVQEEKVFRGTVASVRRKLLPSWQLHDVFQHYDVSADQVIEVVRFLSTHKYLLHILLDARSHIKRVFGQSPVFLEVDQDPNEGFEELFGVIMVAADPKMALSLLARFDQEWFIKVARQTRSKLNFTVDTVKDESI